MALIAGKPWGHVQRAWGYEVRVDITDDATGKIYNERMVFAKEPDKTALTAEIDNRVVALAARLSEPVVEPKPMRTEEEITVELQAKLLAELAAAKETLTKAEVVALIDKAFTSADTGLGTGG